MDKSPKRQRKLFDGLRLNLPQDTGLVGVELFAELAEQLAGYAREGASLSPHLEARKQALLAHLQQGGNAAAQLRDAADVRILLALWREEADLLQRAPLDKPLLKAIQRCLPQPSRLFMWQLIRLYLDLYDALPAWRELGSWLLSQLSHLPEKASEASALKAYRQYAKGLFSKDPALALMKFAAKEKLPFYSAAKRWHLPEASQIFTRACEQYYFAPLSKLKPGQVQPLFDELRQPEAHHLVMADQLLLGHHVCRLLMDKALEANGGLPEDWRHLIIAIMGDPRVPRSAPQFQRWWGRLERKYAQAMRRWLSQLDLKLFLNILEEVARSHDKQDLLRMFPARKRFLEGLHSQGLIFESRLLLGTQAEKYIREHFDLRDLPEFASLGISDASVIYLNLGRAHLLEGTHSFQARLYHTMSIPGLADYESNKFNLATLRKYPAFANIKHSHSKAPIWQRQLVEMLAESPFDVIIDPQGVLSAEDFALYGRASKPA